MTVETVAEEVVRALADHSIEVVTFSGGEPMQQANSLLVLTQTLRRQAPELSFGMFSGYTEGELEPGLYWTWKGLSHPQKRRLWEEAGSHG